MAYMLTRTYNLCLLYSQIGTRRIPVYQHADVILNHYSFVYNYSTPIPTSLTTRFLYILFFFFYLIPRRNLRSSPLFPYIIYIYIYIYSNPACSTINTITPNPSFSYLRIASPSRFNPYMYYYIYIPSSPRTQSLLFVYAWWDVCVSAVYIYCTQYTI